MARRWTGNMNGERYLGNRNKMEVHDLDNEKSQCQIDKIIRAGHDVPFTSLQVAKNRGYDPCAWCLAGSRR